jgi:hypothetical protein
MKCYFDTTLYEVSYWYMQKKRIELTTGNLFLIMEKILQKIDRINKNTKEKIISFKNNQCELIEK